MKALLATPSFSAVPAMYDIDWFAGLALHALISARELPQGLVPSPQSDVDALAAEAYRFAETMVAHRDKLVLQKPPSRSLSS
jgi:hypothetical protein